MKNCCSVNHLLSTGDTFMSLECLHVFLFRFFCVTNKRTQPNVMLIISLAGCMPFFQRFSCADILANENYWKKLTTKPLNHRHRHREKRASVKKAIICFFGEINCFLLSLISNPHSFSPGNSGRNFSFSIFSSFTRLTENVFFIFDVRGKTSQMKARSGSDAKQK